MTTPAPDAATPAGPPNGGMPPWINPEIQQRMRWRDGDIVVSVPVKSGTTWTMNIVHQLREGGDPAVADIYAEVPWIEFVPGPAHSVDAIVARLDGLPATRRRAMKSHSAPPMLPYQAPGTGPDVRYIVVVRSPEEAIVSMFPFIAAHSDAWFDLWRVPKHALVKPDFATFFAEVANPGFIGSIFDFVARWWPLRHADNVLLLHFSDMTRDHEGTIRRIAAFLGYQPTAAQWPVILECTSFPWMKAHQGKFEVQTAADVPVLNEGAMIRKGKTGAAQADGMTDAIAEAMAQIGRGILTDPVAFEWAYRGGPVDR